MKATQFFDRIDQFFSTMGQTTSNGLNAFSEVQLKCMQMVHKELPGKVNRRDKYDDERNRLIQNRQELEHQHQVEINENGITPEYKVDRLWRKRLVFGAAILEGIATGITLLMMFELPLQISIPTGFIVALFIFSMARMEKVLSKDFSWKHGAYFFAGINIIAMISGIIMGIKSDGDLNMMILHSIVSLVSFCVLVIALKYAEDIHKDTVISNELKIHQRIRKDINQKSLAISRINDDIAELITRLRDYAVRCYQIYQVHDMDPVNLRMDPYTTMVLNNVIRQDVFVSNAGPGRLTVPSSDDTSPWPQLLNQYFGTHIDSARLNEPQNPTNFGSSNERNDPGQDNQNEREDNEQFHDFSEYASSEAESEL
jgi:hypothetical protein